MDEECWNNAKSSYRLKLGTLIALNNMSAVKVSELRPSTIVEIQRASADRDEALRTEATKFLDRYRIPFPVTVFEHANSGGRSQTFSEGKFRADHGQLGKLPNDTASSVKVIKGYRVRLCENESEGRAVGAAKSTAKGPSISVSRELVASPIACR